MSQLGRKLTSLSTRPKTLTNKQHVTAGSGKRSQDENLDAGHLSLELSDHLLLLQLSGDPAGRSSGLPEEASPPHEPQHRVRVALQHCQLRDVAQESGPRCLVLWAVADDVLGSPPAS